MSIKLNLDETQLNELRQARGKDPLLVPNIFWQEFIENNDKIDRSDFPSHINFYSYVITDREWFTDVIHSLKYLYIENKRLPENLGGVWLTCKLEPKKTMPKIDIFNGAHRVKGNFRSNG
ncbi:hypothetical protein KI614_08615 [Dechloromonas denitrificans]|uniref:hypothetical protein n=1 Tax=Dechloromonas denitrificans TaxID=281362 RepID=UPI001CF82635|nr:hypothetical protein [Dechloromonas denitrificans]UCV10279.1 hypothetical protein KI614_08615 [Dechloromonas denitrificans]